MNCLYCFPNSPQLKINNRNFKLQHLLGEVRNREANGQFRMLMLIPQLKGRFLLRLPCLRHLRLRSVRAQENSMPFWERVRCASP